MWAEHKPDVMKSIVDIYIKPKFYKIRKMSYIKKKKNNKKKSQNKTKKTEEKQRKSH